VEEVQSDSNDALRSEGLRVRQAITYKRSDLVLRIFDIILEVSVQGRHITEVELNSILNSDLFSTGPNRLNIRVHVLRLRRKLDEFYRHETGNILTIPLGEYRLVLTQRVSHPLSANNRPGNFGKIFQPISLIIVTAVILNLIMAIFLFQRHSGDSNSLSDSAFWHTISERNVSPIVVIGDYFFLAEKNGSDNPISIIRDSLIYSREEFHQLIGRRDGSTASLVDLNLNFASSSILIAIRTLWKTLQATAPGMPMKVSLKSSSQLNPGAFESSDIVYLGPLDGLNTLIATPLKQMSGFTFGPGSKDLIDKRSRRHFVSDGAIPIGNQIPRREYGYIAVFPGPSDNHILLISGTGDAATNQMASLVGDRSALADLQRHLGGKLDSFEALYQVRTMYNQNFNSTLLIARPLRAEGAWDKSMSNSQSTSGIKSR
jgi:hypothetical protein